VFRSQEFEDHNQMSRGDPKRRMFSDHRRQTDQQHHSISNESSRAMNKCFGDNERSCDQNVSRVQYAASLIDLKHGDYLTIEDCRPTIKGEGQRTSNDGNAIQSQQQSMSLESHRGHSQTQYRIIYNADECEGRQQLRTENTDYQLRTTQPVRSVWDTECERVSQSSGSLSNFSQCRQDQLQGEESSLFSCTEARSDGKAMQDNVVSSQTTRSMTAAPPPTEDEILFSSHL